VTVVRRLVIRLLVLLALGVVADRVAVRVAEGVVASQLAKVGHFAATPSVSIAGFPFLTQALGGHYDRIDVSVPAFNTGTVKLRDLRLAVRGTDLPLRQALGGSVDSVGVDGITGSALLPYTALAVGSQVQGLSIVPAGDGVEVKGTVLVAGRQVSGTALASAELEGTVLVVRARSVRTTVASTDAVRAEVGRQLGFRVRLDGLPFGLRVTDVKVGRAGLSLSAGVGPTKLR
jgi:hypothetical protein